MKQPSFEQYNEKNMPVEQGQQPVQQQQDPFAMSSFRNSPLPDVPIQYGMNVVESLINDDEIPEEIKTKYWHVFNRDNVLTFLDQDRKDSKLLNFDIAKIDYLNSIPYFDYDFALELEFTKVRHSFETKLDRALGFNNTTQKNERTVIQSQFSEQRQISDNSNDKVKVGFFKRLLGRR